MGVVPTDALGVLAKVFALARLVTLPLFMPADRGGVLSVRSPFIRIISGFIRFPLVLLLGILVVHSLLLISSSRRFLAASQPDTALY